MAFCKYSSSFINSDTISIEARFLNDYLGCAPENAIKVYLFGLLKCQNSVSYDNTLENFENVLNLTRKDILSAFSYWEDQNVVQIVDTSPPEIIYLPTKNNVKSLKKLNTKKYSSFVSQIDSILSGRQITPNEYYKYIDFIETNHIEPSDFCMIVKYCASAKGNTINGNYILTVAKGWLSEGIRTGEQIEQKIETLDLVTSDVGKVAKALKFRGNFGIEHKQLYEKWTKNYGFMLGDIILIARKVASKTKNYSFEMLDSLLTKYYELHLMSFAEAEEYEANKADLRSLARDINRKLGVYYEVVDNEIETYILPWLSQGFSRDSLLKIANFCFKNSVKTLEDMNILVHKFHKLGLVSSRSIETYFNEIVETDEKILKILRKLGLDRRVNSFDRLLYKTWKDTFRFNDDIIDYAIILSKNKMGGMKYVSSLLSSWHENKLNALDQVVKFMGKNKGKIKTFKKRSFPQRTYTDEEFNAIYDNLDNIKI